MSELNEARIRAAKPKKRPYKLRDGRGLHSSPRAAGGSGASGIGTRGARAWSASVLIRMFR